MEHYEAHARGEKAVSGALCRAWRFPPFQMISSATDGSFQTANRTLTRPLPIGSTLRLAGHPSGGALRKRRKQVFCTFVLFARARPLSVEEHTLWRSNFLRTHWLEVCFGDVAELEQELQTTTADSEKTSGQCCARIAQQKHVRRRKCRPCVRY
jgi:hypothetical protein